MARRITLRLLVLSVFLLALVYVLITNSAYGLSREAQFETVRQQIGGWSGTAQQTNEQKEPLEALPPPTPPPSFPLPESTSKNLGSDDVLEPIHDEFDPFNDVPDDALPLPTPSAMTSTPTQERLHSQTPSPSSTSESLPSRNYTRALVVARTIREVEKTDWLREKVLLDDPNLSIYPYTVDLAAGMVPADRTPENNPTVPKNKGHEAMPYLTYIIDNYESPTLADISLFMHAHRYTWHNNDLLDSDALNIVTRLSTPKVLRDGYFNLRCHLDPGCPNHLHPATKIPNPAQPEEMLIGQAWTLLFPGEDIPEVLSQPCCSQFALSKAQLRSVPLSTYTRLREWLMTTELHDQIAGRVFEYVWQKLYTGHNEWCPIENICYCDGYGVCFGSSARFDKWFDDRRHWRTLARDYGRLSGREKYLSGNGDEPKLEGGPPNTVQYAAEPVIDDKVLVGYNLEQTRTKMVEVREQMAEYQTEMDEARRDAFLKGNDPKERALESGREWKEGDGF